MPDTFYLKRGLSAVYVQNEAGDDLAAIQPDSPLVEAIKVGIRAGGHSLIDRDTGVYLIGTLDQLVGEGV
jgi:hypothetical protein